MNTLCKDARLLAAEGAFYGAQARLHARRAPALLGLHLLDGRGADLRRRGGRRLGGVTAPPGKDTEGHFRTTGPKENADNVREIIRLLRSINPGVQTFLTLSPAPLAATLERKSAIIADCLSKSSLRLAVEDAMADGIDGVRYWPSFEMAKWWGAHPQEGRALAEGDGQTRHVSPWLIEKIIGLFVEYYGDPSLKAEEPADA